MDISLTLTFAGLLGLVIGSFLNVVIVRYPIMLKQRWKEECLEYLNQPLTHKPQPYHLWKPKSHCPQCHQPLKWWHNIPLISYILLLGKCAYCKKSVSLSYPIVEILSAIVTVFCFFHFGTSWQGGLALIFSWSLIVLSFIDIKHQILPDNITISILWIGLFCNAFSLYDPPSFAILGAIVGYLLLWVIARLFSMIQQRETMGQGDVKLFAMIGAWLGYTLLLNVLLTSALIALIVSLILILFKKLSRKNPIAFGPYLAIGAWVTLLNGPSLTHWIARIFI